MKLGEAMSMLRAAPPATKGASCWRLAASFEPLHLGTFLRACFRLIRPEEDIQLVGGVYGSLSANLEKAEGNPAEGCIVMMSWEDLNPCLSWRGNGSLAGARSAASLMEARQTAGRLTALCRQVAARQPVIFVPPVLPLPPFDMLQGSHAGAERAQMRLLVAEMTAELAAEPGIRCLDVDGLVARLPVRRLDLNQLLTSGLPFTTEACSALAKEIVSLMRPPEPLRGLVTDLDNTFWRGIVGEDGVEGIRWDLDGKAQRHGLYQRLLAVLADAGVLLAVASRNDPAVVEKAFQRDDLLINPGLFFPLEVHWGSKVESISCILAAWNIGAGHVLFVDDDEREIERIKEAFPAIHCRLFPPANASAFDDFLVEIRDFFARGRLMAEDAIRAASIRSLAAYNAGAAEDFDEDRFHQSLNARLVITDTRRETDARSLALVLKTNQFNMNGRRPSEAEWEAALSRQNAVAFTFAYEDRFGPLGRIAVITGMVDDGVLTLEHWVMSCRAFNRRIEHACLAWLFEKTGVREIRTTALRTERNGVFFNVLDACGASGDCMIQRDAFLKARPELCFTVQSA